MCCVQYLSRMCLHVIGYEDAMNVDKEGMFPTNVKCVIKARGRTEFKILHATLQLLCEKIPRISH